MTPGKRIPPAGNQGEFDTEFTAVTNGTPTFADYGFDQQVVDRVDGSIWRALFDGHFRLAMRCDICGRWLTSNKSKKAHRGPRCSAKAGAR